MEHVAGAIGVLYKPRAIRLEEKAKTDAKIYELERTTQAYLDTMNLINESEQAIQQRAVDRIRAVELLRQSNIDEVMFKAVKSIEESGERDKPHGISQDWISKYLDYVKDVSDQDVQKIWAKILARQAVEGKRNISLMTLDSLRLLEKHHAELFFEISKRVATFRTCFPFLYEELGEQRKAKEVDSLHALQELGFINIRYLSSPYEVEYLYFPFPGFSLKLSEDENHNANSTAVISEVGLTFRGGELANIVLDNEIIPFYEDFKVPNLDDQYEYMTVEEQTTTFRHWFNLLSKQGGYKLEIIVQKEQDEEQILTWEGKLVPQKKGISTRLLPPHLIPLLEENGGHSDIFS